MSMVVATNVMAMNANRALGVNNSNVSKSMEKLSSGFAINRAADDASGLAISEKMKSQIAGLDQASENAENGISLIQTAEGATTEIHNMLNRIKTLTVKSADGTIQDEVDRETIQSEVDALLEEIDRICDSTNFNGITLLDGSLDTNHDNGGGTDNIIYKMYEDSDGKFKLTDSTDYDGMDGNTYKNTTYKADSLTLQIGDTYDVYNRIDLNVQSLKVADLDLFNTVVTGEVNASTNEMEWTYTDTTASEVGYDKVYGAYQGSGDDGYATMSGVKSLNEGTGTYYTLNVSTQEKAGAALENIENAINTVSMTRSDLGALQNRLEYSINNLDTTSENLSSANSRIRDTDMAEEMMAYTQANVLTQAAQAMLAQANQAPQSTLQLLN